MSLACATQTTARRQPLVRPSAGTADRLGDEGQQVLVPYQDEDVSNPVRRRRRPEQPVDRGKPLVVRAERAARYRAGHDEKAGVIQPGVEPGRLGLPLARVYPAVVLKRPVD